MTRTKPKAIKNDRKDDKPRWELLPLPLIEKIVEVYTFGAKKYAPNSWQQLEDGYNRYKAALLRHIVAYEKGEQADPESGLHPLAHAAWNAIALLFFALKNETKHGSTQNRLRTYLRRKWRTCPCRRRMRRRNKRKLGNHLHRRK